MNSMHFLDKEVETCIGGNLREIKIINKRGNMFSGMREVQKTKKS